MESSCPEYAIRCIKWNHIAQNNLLGIYNGIILPRICY